MDFEAYRDEFPIFRTKRYLNTCSMGPLATRVREAVARFLVDWDELGAHAWYERWLEAIDAVRGKFARLVGARKEEIALAANVSSALAAVANSLDYGKRHRVVATDLDFPTIPYQWMARPETEVHLIASPDTTTVPVDAYAGCVGEDTVAVATSHVFFATGFRQDIPAIARTAHEAGALCIVDGYHATGQLPLDVGELGVDFYVSGSLKWLLGGPGVAFLYVRRDLIPGLAPRSTGWFANSQQFEFDPHSFDYRGDARRFEMGTPANAAVFAAGAGLDLILEVGPSAIYRRTLDLANDLVERARDADLDVRVPSRQSRTGIVMVEHPDAAGAVERLVAADIIADHRGPRVRLSPYFFNTFEENEAAVGVLSKTLGA